MAIVAFTLYTGNTDCQRTNDYICDGHGASVSRTNRYIFDGHGQTTLLEGYNCPADPILATEYMRLLRLNYETQHPSGENRIKGHITHQQIYVSPTEKDNVPAQERMEMMRKLIERTKLRNFASLYTPHDNRPDKHGHISICPYSLPDENGRTHKLCMNNTLLNTLRREMDYICVEHGYSIVENRELWSDKSYREWFLRIKEEGVIKIHPPREQDHTSFKKDRKRSRNYAISKQSQRLRQEKQVAFYKHMTRSYSEKTADFFYTPPHLYDPNHPEHALHIRKYDKNGAELSELEQVSVGVFIWAFQSANILKSRTNNRSLQKRMYSLANKAFQAKDLIRSLDIRTHAELIAHIKECGSDIAELKQEISRQNTILSCQIDSAGSKIFYSRASERKASAEALLAQRKAEYRHLKEAEATLHPAATRKEWQEYLESVPEKEAVSKIGYMDEVGLRKHLHQVGKTIGLLDNDVEQLICSAKNVGEKTTWIEYRAFMRITLTADNSGIVSAIYDEIRQDYQAIRALRNLEDDLVAIGPFSLLLVLAIAFYAGMREAALESDIEELTWEAELQKEYARQTRRTRRNALREAKAFYDTETVNTSKVEIEASHIRFYEKAAKIVGRLDILAEIQNLRAINSLDETIEKAVQQKFLELPNRSSRKQER